MFKKLNAEAVSFKKQHITQNLQFRQLWIEQFCSACPCRTIMASSAKLPQLIGN